MDISKIYPDINDLNISNDPRDLKKRKLIDDWFVQQDKPDTSAPMEFLVSTWEEQITGHFQFKETGFRMFRDCFYNVCFVNLV